MIAFGAADHPAAEVFRVGDIGHQLVIDVRHQQIGARDGFVKLVAQLIDQMIQCARHVGLGINIGILVQYSQRFPVKDLPESCRVGWD